jgi:regulatory protein
MGSAGPAPQGDPSADTEAVPGAAHPGTPAADTEALPGAAHPGVPAAASRGGGAPPAEVPEAVLAGPDAASPAPAAATSRGGGAPPAGAVPAGADAASPPRRPLDGLADALAPESLGTLAAEPPAATEHERREEAFNAAWRFIARRERTEAEVRARLERNDVEAPLVDEVLDELRTGGYVDDAGYATRFAEDRRNLDGWGADRIERRLRELGVDRAHIAAALAAGDHDELAAATALLARRYPVPPQEPRDLEKALGFLVRKGFDLELAHDAIRRHAASALER